MSETPTPPPASAELEASSVREPRSRGLRATILLLGVIVVQCVLYGPSLLGDKVLLPLDLLQEPGVYQPRDPRAAPRPSSNSILTDQVLAIELRRQFATSEVRQGRLPLWNPHTYCGAPFLAANNTEVFSPFRVLDYFAPGPTTIAWNVLLRALLGALGFYLLARRILGCGYWAATLTAWAFPLTGFQVLWTGYPPSHAAVWLPWMLYAVAATLRRPRGLGVVGLAAVTALTLISGHAATGAQLLVAAGVFGIGYQWSQRGGGGLLSRESLAGFGALGLGWGLGALISGPQTLPTAEYLQTSLRVALRGEGVVETLSQGWGALAQLVAPQFYGSSADGAPYLIEGNRLEHAATGYAGMLFALLFAPLAWAGVAGRDARSKAVNYVLLALVVLGLVQVLALPGLSLLLELPPLELLRNNRLVFITGLGLLALAARGFDGLLRGARPQGWAMAAAPLIALAALALSAFGRALSLPEPVGSVIPKMLADPAQTGRLPAYLRTQEAVEALQSSLSGSFVAIGFWACVGIGLWVALVLRARRSAVPVTLVLSAAVVALFEMLISGHGEKPQCDPALYYPRIAALERVAAAEPVGRAIGLGCLPANLLQTHGLLDLRGYDGADPAAITRVLQAAQDPRAAMGPEYARTQSFLPRADSAIPAMLGLRYTVHPGAAPKGLKPWFEGEGYFVQQRPALPRAYVPAHATSLRDSEQQLERVAAEGFDPADRVFVDADLGFGPEQTCAGTATLVDRTPTHVSVTATMRTAGVLVLADQFDAGWQASIDGEPVEVCRANHALRGVVLPPGVSTVEFVYAPASLRYGWIALLVGLLGCAGWWVWMVRGYDPIAPVLTDATAPR